MREFLTRNSSLQMHFQGNLFGDQPVLLLFHVPFHVGFIWLRARSHSWFAICWPSAQLRSLGRSHFQEQPWVSSGC
jgi:hypothetical protein